MPPRQATLECWFVPGQQPRDSGPAGQHDGTLPITRKTSPTPPTESAATARLSSRTDPVELDARAVNTARSSCGTVEPTTSDILLT